MKIYFIIAQIFGVFALITVCYSLTKNNKKSLLKYQLISNLFYAIQYLFLEAYTGFATHIMCVVRNYAYSKYENGKVPLNILIAIICSLCLLSIWGYDGPSSLLPSLGVIIFSFALWQKNMTIARIGEVTGVLLCIIYNFIVKAYSGNISMFIELTMVLIAIYRFDIKKQ